MLDELRNKRGMIVIIIAHSKVERFEDPENTAYDRYAPRLHKAATGLLCEWADAVMFATKRFRVNKENAGFAGERGIVGDGSYKAYWTVGPVDMPPLLLPLALVARDVELQFAV